ncbi:type II CRISPR RNA-guided endonuclease Cas9 [Flavobacteriaceae bacterium F89]|uniref:CRISPR-associated endonuclease Cas9 n=1 Tax=Cerina litoralis TaxID=2874477 RepID=A0AAE3EYG8_9FLAO|nr:type II CRISPR RNA-guided endonuclease Cas9 [Cerina litoralis]MCG2462820.1 type II CRISPR RNA-guided endonuclease Cas9 [Cerina litoralis]
MKRILGLDLGTNSIGWALVEQDFENKQGRILGAGSRIIPMSQDILGDFGKGNSISQTAERTGYRGVRRLRERHLLRRQRLHRVLNVLNFLPAHYASQIDFKKRFGQFLEETEPKLAWKENGKDQFEFLFQNSFSEMVAEFKTNGQDIKIPCDWTIYYLRKKALSQKIAKEELAWIILNFNQKRGYYQLRGEEEEENPNKLVEFHSLKVIEVKPEIKYTLTLENGETYYRTSDEPIIEWKDTMRDFIVTIYSDNKGVEKRTYFLKEDTSRIKKKKTNSGKKKTSEYVEVQSIKIIDVKEEKQDKIWYSLVLENGWIYRRESKTDLSDWKDKVKDFIVTTDLNDDGAVKTNQEGEEKRSFRAPKDDDWTLIKKKTESDLNKHIKVYKLTKGVDGTVGTYIYENLLKHPNQKIRGKLVRTIERKFYKDELRQILKKQIQLHAELFTENLYNDCVHELYRSNEAHQMQLSKRDFVQLLLNDIIFYQRPLKSQKSSIGNCSLEYRTFKVKEGNEQTIYLKAIPKSNPYYQEFRVWQWLYNLKIYTKEDDREVTIKFIRETEDLERLFEFLMCQKEVDHKAVLKQLLAPRKLKGKALNSEIAKYRWNYVYDADKDESKKYPMNETGYEIRRRLNKVENVPENFLSREVKQHLWHLIYSVTDKTEYEKALKSFAKKYGLVETPFIENFKKFKPFNSDYGRYSEKAIKKLLPLLRHGKYWSWDAIDKKTRARIDKIITGEYDEEIKDRVREKAIRLTEEKHFQGLQLWLAQYIVYDRHSEANVAGKWNSIDDLEEYLKEFKQHSLRNPIVEQVVTETLRVVKDIWKQYGKGVKDYFDEIHIELGRDMKNPADARKRLTNIISDNENTNLRIKTILSELMNDNSVENVRPYSPMQQEALKIYEDGVLNSGIEIPDEIEKISKKSEPTKSEIQRYKLWLEQKYCSPYTGKPIPLSKLFTSAYEIEHIIPQSRYFDDSFSNKVICEAEVNSLKDKQLGLEFIKSHYGQKVTTNLGEVEILTEDAYKNFVKEHYDKNRGKRNKLLLEEIPEKMIERQLNDTRYISKFVSNLLSNIVRDDKDDEGINSKNIIPGNGKITGRLKQDWGLNDVWNDLILPRFERMNALTKSTDFTSWNEKHQKFLPTVPLELSKGFQKKRIDHRHHALDALVIACATSEHVNLLNNKHAKSKNERYDLQHKLRHIEKWQDNNGKGRVKFTEFKKPWNNFTVDAKNELEKIVVSFKQNLQVINKATNHYEKFVNGKKVKVEQQGVNWAIRKPMHEETVSGIINLPWVKLGKGEIITATRERNDLVTIFKDVKTKEKAESKISKITDTGIQKILINYLKSRNNNPELAFSPEGIEDMNKNITQFNGGKFHHSIFKVRTYEKGKGRFVLGAKGNKKRKYVQGAPNLFFAVYWDEKKQKRNYETIPLNIVIERQKQGLSSVPETDEKGNGLLFHLSPNDLVYVPIKEELENNSNIDFGNLTNEQRQVLYNVNDFSSTCYYSPNSIAKAIAPKEVDLSFDEKKNKVTGSFDTKTASVDGVQIKDVCIKLKIDRLGNIKKA